MQPQWPNLFVVGAAKAGTTSLWRYLGDHPEIFMSPVKEPDFFAVRRAPTADETEAYLGLFAGAGGEKLRGEASPSYITHKSAPAAIRRASPDARIVISLREPVERTHSSYLSLVNDGVERRRFLEAVRDDLAGRRVPGCPHYVKPTLYATGVQRYLDAFGSRVFVMFFEDLVADAPGCLRDLYEFLEVDPSFADDVRAKAYNQFRQPRNAVTTWLLRVRRLGRPVVPTLLRDRASRALTKPAEKPRPDAEAVRLLHDVYEPDVTELRNLLARPLPAAWERLFPAAEPVAPGARAG
jgi:hypothetical protein